MRTKILSAAVAALALGLVSSNASPVYSANVVGYYNTALPAGQYTLVGNQLDAATNDLNSILSALPNKSSVSVWTGTSFTGSQKGASGWSPDLTIGVGQGFWVKTPSAATNTFVGTVAAAPGGSVTNSLAGGEYALVASPIPYATDLNNTNDTLGLLTLPNKSSISVWTGSAYTGSQKGASGWSPDLNISVGQGFWLKPASSANWVQTLPSN